jgi:hypothetical protein
MLAQTGIDIAATGKVLHIKSCSAPLILFAEAMRRVSKLGRYKLNWGIDGLLVEADCSYKQCTLSGNQNNFSAAEGVIIQKIKSNYPHDPQPKNQVYRKSLTQGILVDKEPWEQVLKVAKRGLVTSTVQSRASAGAEVDDSN